MLRSRSFLRLSVMLLFGFLVLAACAPAATPVATDVPATEGIASPFTAPNIETGTWTGTSLEWVNEYREEEDKLSTVLDLLRLNLILQETESGEVIMDYDATLYQLLVKVGDESHPIEEWVEGKHDGITYQPETLIEWGLFPIPTEETTTTEEGKP